MIEDFIEDFNNIDQLDRLRDRYEGIYIILYSKGKPDEIWFYGYSGD